MDADVFNTIKQKATRTESHLGATARRDFAVARRWGGKLDIVVRALLVGPLLGYFGIGTIQTFDADSDDDLPVWIPASEALQIYIPGLREKDPQSGELIFAVAFRQLTQERIGWDRNV